jgi:hypothetical protein
LNNDLPDISLVEVSSNRTALFGAPFLFWNDPSWFTHPAGDGAPQLWALIPQLMVTVRARDPLQALALMRLALRAVHGT